MSIAYPRSKLSRSVVNSALGGKRGAIVQLQRPVLCLAVAHAAQINSDRALGTLARGFPVDEFYNQQAVSLGEPPFAGHLELRKRGVEGLEAERSSKQCKRTASGAGAHRVRMR
jgi:hypothetical protein